ncbi:hypothetical protein EDB85DRAFT_1885236 [Lactarius pseudohatsudake]|nr:hypothetical protein EDB85DRAFT_1885236 [Lactarius pseudohatsudake]
MSAVEETTYNQLFRKEDIQIIHEVMLQDLLCFRNFAAIALLAECNELLQERCIIPSFFSRPWFLITYRVSLRGTPFNYSEVEFLSKSAPAKMQPYKIMGDGWVRQYWAKQPSWAQYPPNVTHQFGQNLAASPQRCQFSRGTQTEDPINADTMLTEITLSVQTGEPMEEVKKN